MMITTSAMRLGLLSAWTAPLLLWSSLVHGQSASPPAEPTAPGAVTPTGEIGPSIDSPAEELPLEPPTETAEPVRSRITAAPVLPAQTPPEEAAAPAITPFAQDTLAGQFQLGVSGLFAMPFGEVSRGADFDALTSVGFGPGVDLGIGVGRHLVVGAYGDLNFYGAGSACTDCSSTSLGVGAFVRYHLVQGLRFDPWVSYGIGYRDLRTASDRNGASEYSGLEWMRLTFGGDWYANRQFGFGPLVSLSAASFLDAPASADVGGVNWRFQAGLRVLLDLPGR